MTILISLILSFSTINNAELQLSYWVCDVIRQEKNVDFVVLPFDYTLSYKTDSLIITPMTIK